MSYSICLSICLCLRLCLLLTVYLSICLSVYLSICLSIYLPVRLSIRLSGGLPPAAVLHPYCPQGFLSHFRRKYTQSCVICQSVVVKVASHGCKFGLFAPVSFHVCCPELRQEPAQLRVLRNSPRAMPLFGLPIMVMTALCTS